MARSFAPFWRAASRAVLARARLHLAGSDRRLRFAGDGAVLVARHLVGRDAPGALVQRRRSRRAVRAIADGPGRGRATTQARPTQRRVRERPLSLDPRRGAVARPDAGLVAADRSECDALVRGAAGGGVGRGRWRPPLAAAHPAQRGRLQRGAILMARAPRPMRAMQGGRLRRHMRGFTLIEVLLAMVLLVAGLTLAFATLSAATK